MIITRRVTLPYLGFLTAWSALDLGSPPTALLPARAIDTAGDSREAITERAWQDLYEQGLALGRWEVTDDFGRTLELLATASTRFYGFVHDGDGGTHSILVAGAKVVAIVDGDSVTLRPSWTDSGARALVDLLPQVPKVRGEPLSAPAAELARGAGPGFLGTVRPTGQDAVTAKMRWWLTRPRTGGGQLYAARRDRPGHYRVCDRPLSYFDTADGRVVATEREAGDGIRWRSLIPADPALLVSRLSALLPR